MENLKCEVIPMKKIAIITSNKIFGQSLESSLALILGNKLQLFLLSHYRQALVDAEILEIDLAIIDMGIMDGMENHIKEEELTMTFFQNLNSALPDCKILLLVSQKHILRQKTAIQAKEKKLVQDYVFYDVSLQYLSAKITSLI